MTVTCYSQAIPMAPGDVSYFYMIRPAFGALPRVLGGGEAAPIWVGACCILPANVWSGARQALLGSSCKLLLRSWQRAAAVV